MAQLDDYVMPARPHEHRAGAHRHRGLDRRGQVHAGQLARRAQGLAVPACGGRPPARPFSSATPTTTSGSPRENCSADCGGSTSRPPTPASRSLVRGRHGEASRRASRCSTRPTSTRSSRSTTRSRTACSTRPTCGSSSPPPPATPTPPPGTCCAWPRSAAPRLAIVLSRVQPKARDVVVKHFVRMLTEYGLGEVDRFVINESEGRRRQAARQRGHRPPALAGRALRRRGAARAGGQGDAQRRARQLPHPRSRARPAPGDAGRLQD